MGDQYLSALAVKAVVALQKDDLELCISLARRVEVQPARTPPSSKWLF